MEGPDDSLKRPHSLIDDDEDDKKDASSSKTNNSNNHGHKQQRHRKNDRHGKGKPTADSSSSPSSSSSGKKTYHCDNHGENYSHNTKNCRHCTKCNKNGHTAPYCNSDRKKNFDSKGGKSYKNKTEANNQLKLLWSQVNMDDHSDNDSSIGMTTEELDTFASDKFTIRHYVAIKDAVEHDNRFRIEIRAFKRTYHALIDTGATHSFIRQDIVKDHNIPFTKIPGNFTLANKSTVERIGVTDQVEFEFNGRFLSAPFEIIGDQEFALTIGMDLFYHMGFALCGLPDIKEMSPAHDVPVEDEKPSLRPITTPEEELTADFKRMKGRFLDAISKALKDNENISKTSHCPVPEMMVYLPVPKEDNFPLPLISEIMQKVAGHSIYSTIGLTQAYHRLPIHKEDRHLTAFMHEAEKNMKLMLNV
ncbi:hypothetical protein KI688_006605 [Linnemannia hyalina]|uniref:Uncharacterized protein n=1 Tax=Linnemannia hyalina TaxID=64524 RepID=A0A9P8BNN4_9FUNG|nr:hypothetical protein KI688_006605 [Linnemannia hyalina]